MRSENREHRDELSEANDKKIRITNNEEDFSPGMAVAHRPEWHRTIELSRHSQPSAGFTNAGAGRPTSLFRAVPMRYTYHSEQWLPYPLEVVFAFFANPENLPRLMPHWHKARIEEAAFAPPPPAPQSRGFPSRKTIVAGVGTRLTLSFRPFPYSPVRLPWEAEISEFIWNDHFCDRQLRGPFAYWRHCHNTHSEARVNPLGILIQGTLLRDDIEYELPFDKLGGIAQRLFIARQLKNTFAYRSARTSELLSLPGT